MEEGAGGISFGSVGFSGGEWLGGVKLSRLTDNRIGGTRTAACIPLILLGSVGIWQTIGGHSVAGTPEVFLLVAFLCMIAKAAVLNLTSGAVLEAQVAHEVVAPYQATPAFCSKWRLA